MTDYIKSKNRQTHNLHKSNNALETGWDRLFLLMNGELAG